ncbi:MAG TPA: SDR family oxidoreductase [Pirellulales bacterium]|jgi:enoyl-[acyl-carrier protein] reductase III|nr:SDR family oxidoreductase [Pirellulales bacterium]
MIDLSDKVALVTGASRGIGRACAERLAEAGADVVVNYVSSVDAARQTVEAVQRHGRRAIAVKADVSEQDDVREMVEFIKQSFGRLDIVVSNAASGGFRPVMGASAKNFEAAMNTNVRALMYLVQSTVPLLEKSPDRAKIVALSSHGSQIALPWYGLIGASKAALEALVRNLTLELGDRGINLNIVLAGLVETDSTRRIPNSQDIFAARRQKTMTGERMLEAEDVANAVLYLCSPLSDLVQGATLVVDGGAAIHV